MTLDKDLALAARLQQNLLPRIPDSFFWQIDYYFRPCTVVSGDFIDIYTFGDVFFDDDLDSDEQVGIILLDAAGHGVSAALICAIARPIFFKAHRDYKDHALSAAMFEANIELIDQIGEASTYMTGISVRLGADYLAYTNSSHPLILYFRARTGKVFMLPNDANFLGNRIVRGQLKTRKIAAEPGDIMLMYTDGLSEGENTLKKQFNALRISEALKENSEKDVSEIIKSINLAAADFGYDYQKATDDISFVVAKKQPGAKKT